MAVQRICKVAVKDGKIDLCWVTSEIVLAPEESAAEDHHAQTQEVVLNAILS